MGDFKEWLSDNLRYFLVGVVVILIIGGSILGLKIYSSKVNGNSDPAVIRKNTEAQTETGKETETKKQTEKETKKQTEKETKKQTEKETKKQTEKATEKQTESSTSSNAGTDSKGHPYALCQPATCQADGFHRTILLLQYRGRTMRGM